MPNVTQPISDSTTAGRCQKTFTFSQSERDGILTTESLFDSSFGENLDTPVELNDLSKRRTRTYLHMVTLSDYVRHGIIPHGLRWQKEPMLGRVL